ncbi:hypothetical protein [Lacrimispora indolis]|uniref:hypothetical protein n=1 Tax=Lacrimispora indolis TaxID=69825 RepID=UPI00045EAA30|nr:hypothetical protein [Lacrimispora indolis]
MMTRERAWELAIEGIEKAYEEKFGEPLWQAFGNSVAYQTYLRQIENDSDFSDLDEYATEEEYKDSWYKWFMDEAEEITDNDRKEYQL